MKKLTFCLMLLAGLMSSSAWASSYYASLTTKVATECKGMGMVYASTSNSTPSDDEYAESSGPVQSDSTSTSGGNVTLYAFAKAAQDYEFLGWSMSETGATTYASTDNPWKASLKASTTKNGTQAYTYYAYFKELVYDPFYVSFLPPTGGTYTVDDGGLDKRGPFTKTYSPRLKATAADGYAFNGWYTTTDGGATKTLLSREANYTASFIAATTVMAEFVESVKVTTFAELKKSLDEAFVIEIPSNIEIVVPRGENLELSGTQTLIVNGTLFVEGSLTVSGEIAGGGKVSKCKYAYKQSDLRNPYGTKKYWVTEVETASGSVTGYSQTANHVRITNGNGVIFRKLLDTASPAAIICSVDSSVAINHITGITDTSKTSIGNCFSTSLAQLALLTAAQTFSSTSADTGNEHGIIDGASKYTFTYSPKNTTAGYKHTIVNGGYSCTVSSSNGGYYGNCSFYNCTSISIKNFVGKNSNAQMHIYDCTYTSSSISGFNEKTPIEGSINFYSGGPYSTGNFKSGYEGFYYIFGGSWNKNGTKPAAERIAKTMVATHKFYQHDDGCWYLEPKGPAVVTIDGEEYDDMDEAFAAVTKLFESKSSIKMAMEKNATVKSSIMIPKDNTLEIELMGCCITAETGLAVNHGTLLIGDEKANLKGTEGGRVLTKSGNLIENDGTVEVTFGYYTGNVALNGGTFTTHHGRFEGDFIPKTGLDGKTVADLRGGYFAKNVTSLLKDGEGYLQTRNYVGKFPKPDVSSSYKNTDGGYWMYAFTTLPNKDLEIYNDGETKGRSGFSSVADWQRYAEVKSMVQPWMDAGYTVDIVAGFDRDIKKSTATAHLTKPVSTDEPLGRDVGAAPNDLYRILSEYLIDPVIGDPADQKFYNAFLSDSTFQNISFGVSSEEDANIGTTVNLRFDLCLGAVHTDISKLKSYYALMSEYVVLGAGKTNQAMIQPKSGAATFYATIAAAVAACEEGGTIKLCNNITSTDAITISKAVKIDTNGMEFKGTFVAGTNYKMTAEEKVLDIEKYLGKKRCTYTFELDAIPFTLPGVENGTVTADPESPVTPNAKVTVTVTPNTGCFFVDGSSSKSFSVTITTAGQQVEIPDGVDIRIKEAYVPADPENEITIELPTGGTAPVKVTKTIVEDLIKKGIIKPVGEKPTAAEVSAWLNTKQANELTVWQNIVMGVDGTKKENEFATIGEKGVKVVDEKEVEVVVVKTPIAIDEFDPNGDMNVTVTYTLLKKGANDTDWVTVQKGLRIPAVDIVPSDLEVGDVLWKFEAVFKTSGGE